MTLTARDRKLLAILLVIAAVGGYWFLILGPKRQQAQEAAQQLIAQEQRRDTALANLARLESARTSFAGDYARVMRLGKAIPSDVDVPSLMVQLEDAADGAGIEFDSIEVGERTAAPVAAAGSEPAPPPAGSEPPAAPGGEPAESAPGEVAESAGETAEASAAPDTPADGSETSVAEPTAGQPTTSFAAGLETVALEFSFEGDFFDLADLFHELKRFVKVRGDRIDVNGRLLTVDTLSLTPTEKGDELTAQIGATAYLVPAAEGATAGATPAGPPTQPANEPAPAEGTTPPAAAGTAPAGTTP